MGLPVGLIGVGLTGVVLLDPSLCPSSPSASTCSTSK